MTKKFHLAFLLVTSCLLTFSPVATYGGEKQAGEKKPRRVCDVLWVWGNPDMAQPGEHNAANFATASPGQRARILGVPNVMMAGPGLPHDRALAAKWSADVEDAPRLVWEILSDGDKEHTGIFVYKRRIADLVPLVKKYPQIEAVSVDDMTTVAAGKGFKPQHLRDIKQLLKEHNLPLELWGVLYTMSFPNPKTDPLIHELDRINLWHWHAKDTAKMEQHVAECEKRYPGKPIVLGLYMYDYGDARRMPLDLHRQQCDTALKLLHDGRVEELVLLSLANDEQIIRWSADWVKQIGGQTIGDPPAESLGN